MRVIFISCVLVAAACGSKSDPTANPTAEVVVAHSEEEGQASVIPEPSGLFACKAKAVASAKASDKAEVAAIPYDVQGCPAIPSLFGEVSFGMTRDEVAIAIGRRGEVTDSTGRELTFPSSISTNIHLGEPGDMLQLSVRFSEAGKVDMLSHKIDAKGFERLKSAWGEAFALKSLVYTTYHWFNPEAGLRASAKRTTWRRNSTGNGNEEVEGFQLSFEPYTPLAQALGSGGLLSKELIGKTSGEVRRVFPEVVGIATAPRDLFLPPTETSLSSFYVILSWTDGKLDSYATVLDYHEDKTLKAELLAVVASVLGKPSAGPGRHSEYSFAGPNGQVVRLAQAGNDMAWVLQVSKP